MCRVHPQQIRLHPLSVFFLHRYMVAQLENASASLVKRACAKKDDKWIVDLKCFIYHGVQCLHSVGLFLLRKYNIKWFFESPSFLVRLPDKLTRPVINCTCYEGTLLLQFLRVYIYICVSKLARAAGRLFGVRRRRSRGLLVEAQFRECADDQYDDRRIQMSDHSFAVRRFEIGLGETAASAKSAAEGINFVEETGSSFQNLGDCLFSNGRTFRRCAIWIFEYEQSNHVVYE